MIAPRLVDKARRFGRSLGGALVVLIACATTAVGQAPPPNGDWRSLDTEHFHVVFPAGLEPTGRRAAGFAEAAWERLAEVFVEPPTSRIQLLVTDHTDFSNGFARWVPYNRIVVYVRPPAEGFGIAYHDDWLETVITHEVAHVFHLDRSGTIGGWTRRIFGRAEPGWPYFPNEGTPGWVIEGLATYYESLITGTGRVEGTFHEMVLRTAALENGLERFDQISGPSPVWPAGQRRYVYGSLFFDAMVARADSRQIGDFADAVARQWLPFRMEAAAKQAFGTTFSDAWDDWIGELISASLEKRDSLSAWAPLTEFEPLTRGARQARMPVPAPDGSGVAFVRADGRSDTQLRWTGMAGEGGRGLGRLANQGSFFWTSPTTLVAEQFENDGPYALRSGLVEISTGGARRWITRGTRIAHPGPGPEGWILAIQEGQGTNRLVRVRAEDGYVEAFNDFEADVQWSYPRASPDGRWIAVGRREPGALFDVWLLDPSGTPVTRVTRDRAIDQWPVWSPDGRWLLWVSDRSGIPNVYAVRVDTDGSVGELRQVTNVATGLAQPSLSPDGAWLYVSVYHADGWDIERTPFAEDRMFEPMPVDSRFVGAVPGGLSPVSIGVEARSYSPWSTLRPTFWEPIHGEPVSRRGREVLGRSLGFSLSQSDLVDRHTWTLSSAFRTSGRADYSVGYTYRGLPPAVGQPRISVGFDQRHSTDGPFLASSGRAVPDTVYRGERERSVGVGVSFVRERRFDRLGLTLAANHVWENRWLLDTDLDESPLQLADPNTRLGELSATLSFSTARTYSLSTTTTNGVSGFVRLRGRRDLALPDSLRGVREWDRGFREIMGRTSLYRGFDGPGFSSHSVALRVAGGHAWGAGADAFHWAVGGASGRPESVSGLELFGGRSLFLPVRGYFEGERVGATAWSASAEYRFPIWNVHRGWGLAPAWADRLSGALFADAGNAWNPVVSGLEDVRLNNPRGETLTSVGAELQAQWVLFFNSPLTVRFGAAHRLTTPRGGNRFYLRVGASF